MFPDAASLYVMGVDDRQHVADKKGFWHTRQLVSHQLPLYTAVAMHACLQEATALPTWQHY